jgi:hypothetical protein
MSWVHVQFERVCKSGAVSAKLVSALAASHHVMKVGEVEEGNNRKVTVKSRELTSIVCRKIIASGKMISCTN